MINIEQAIQIAQIEIPKEEHTRILKPNGTFTDAVVSKIN